MLAAPRQLMQYPARGGDRTHSTWIDSSSIAHLNDTSNQSITDATGPNPWAYGDRSKLVWLWICCRPKPKVMSVSWLAPICATNYSVIVCTIILQCSSILSTMQCPASPVHWALSPEWPCLDIRFHGWDCDSFSFMHLLEHPDFWNFRALGINHVIACKNFVFRKKEHLYIKNMFTENSVYKRT